MDSAVGAIVEAGDGDEGDGEEVDESGMFQRSFHGHCNRVGCKEVRTPASHSSRTGIHQVTDSLDRSSHRLSRSLYLLQPSADHGTPQWVHNGTDDHQGIMHRECYWNFLDRTACIG